MKEIAAFDFDGTIVENKFPEIGDAKLETLKLIKRENDQGNYVIIWTCRDEEYIEYMKFWLSKHGIQYDAINMNAPWVNFTESRKIFAHRYYDDRAVKI